MTGRRIIAVGLALLAKLGAQVRLANRRCHAIERAAERRLWRFLALHRRLAMVAVLALLANFGSCVWFANRHSPAIGEAIEAARPGPFKVTIRTAASRVAVQQPFEVHVRIVNPGREPRGFTVEADGLGAHLGSSNPDVRCRTHWRSEPAGFGPEVVSLGPGESYEKAVKLVVSDKAPGRVTFRLGFRPIGALVRTSWSNKLTLQVESDGMGQTSSPR